MASGFKGIFLVASNPVDILSQVIAEVSGLPKNRIIGTGTLLETARLREMISEEVRIDPKNIHGYVLGEHGNSSFTAWSNVSVGSLALKSWLKNHPESPLADFDYYDQRVREIGFDIFEGKGNTSYGIAAALARLTRAVIRNEASLMPVSSYLTGQYGIDNLYIGAPCVVDKTGVREVLEIELTEEELAAYHRSAAVLRENFDSIKHEL